MEQENTYKGITISTGNLSQAGYEWLWENLEELYGFRDDFGIQFLSLRDTLDNRIDEMFFKNENAIPQDVIELFEWLKQHEISFLRIDQDGDYAKNLKRWEW